jgi:selenium metabolism protein YedF
MAGTFLIVASDTIGADPELGALLTQSFFNSVGRVIDDPATVWFVNRGVHLALEGSPILDSLKEMSAKGWTIYSCGTCLDYFDATEILAVGEIGNMMLFEELAFEAERVISL